MPIRYDCSQCLGMSPVFQISLISAVRSGKIRSSLRSRGLMPSGPAAESALSSQSARRISLSVGVWSAALRGTHGIPRSVSVCVDSDSSFRALFFRSHSCFSFHIVSLVASWDMSDSCNLHFRHSPGASSAPRAANTCAISCERIPECPLTLTI